MKELLNKRFPCMMIAEKTGTVVLFSEPKKGVIVKDNLQKQVGYFNDDWDMERFTPFEGTVKLSKVGY
jgi:hypothetical protein